VRLKLRFSKIRFKPVSVELGKVVFFIPANTPSASPVPKNEAGCARSPISPSKSRDVFPLSNWLMIVKGFELSVLLELSPDPVTLPRSAFLALSSVSKKPLS
jgi:hypothetical protein